MNLILFRRLLGISLFLITSLSNSPVFAHGGVVLEEDRCVINIGFLTAHFTVYQTETSGNREFCEDIPDVSTSVFVMEYLHDFLYQMPVDFRIIRDVNDVGAFARWEDVQAIDDIEAPTVFYQSSRIQASGVYSVEYAFEEKGTYIGVVTAQHPTEDSQYNAVFYFQVGGADFGTIPLFIAIVIVLQLGYWLANGGIARIRAAKQA
jgi:hypothetical protein